MVEEDDGDGGVAPALITLGFNDFTDESGSLNTRTVGSAGGTLSINDPGSPLNGLEIVVPAGATPEDIEFTVSYAQVTDANGLPDGTTTRSLIIKIQADGSDEWNTFGMFDQAVRVTLPFDNSSGDIVGFYVYNEDGDLEPVGMEGIAGGTLTFWTRTFANSADDTDVTGARAARDVSERAFNPYQLYVAIGIAAQTWADWMNTGKVVNTGFTAASNGFYIPNYGSYYKGSRGGNCMGMVGFAKFYYSKRYAQTLYTKYRDRDTDDPPTTTWLDDGTAIELASRVHNGMSDIWNQFVTGELNEQTPSSSAVARSMVGAMYITSHPALIYIQQAVTAGGATTYSGAHAILTYRADIDAGGNITFYIYDPNHPNNDSRRIQYVNGTGFQQYLSGTDAGSSSFTYNFFKHFGYHVGMSDAALTALKNAADVDFENDSVFPTITLTAITGKNNSEDVLVNTGFTDEGQEKYVTSDTSIRIQGTVLGGLAQTAGSVVNNLRVLTPGGNYSTPVNNTAARGGDGTFDITIPIQQGENMIALLAAKSSSFSHWAAFKLIIIESTASVADLTVTLTWAQNDSDMDLYVKEPDEPEEAVRDLRIGDTVYYSNREGVDTDHPYLDFDNTSGFGPEHYIAENGMTTLYTDASAADGLYGDYTVRVHYYADRDDDDQGDQTINWLVHWRYLAFCPGPCDDPENDGFWVEGSRSGALSTADSGTCCNINNGGPAWSDAWTISYDEPDPEDYAIPDPPDVMLP